MESIHKLAGWRSRRHCNTLQHTCNTPAILYNTPAPPCTHLQHPAAHCNTLQHTAAHCSTLQYTAAHCSTLQHTATHCNTPATWRASTNLQAGDRGESLPAPHKTRRHGTRSLAALLSRARGLRAEGRTTYTHLVTVLQCECVAGVLQCGAVSYSVMQWVELCCSVSVLQVCCSVLQ